MLTTTFNESLEDEEIVNRVADGETALFELLIRRNNPYLYKIGRSYGYNHQDVQDLMQESFIECYQHLTQLENKALFKFWLAKIMLNKCNKRSRKFSFTKNVNTGTVHLNDIPMFSGERDGDAMSSVERKELGVVVEKAMLKVPLDYRLVFTMRELNRFTVDETAKALGLASVNVRVKLNRAKALLRKELAKVYTPEELFPFNLIYCDRIVANVMEHIHNLKHS